MITEYVVYDLLIWMFGRHLERIDTSYFVTVLGTSGVSEKMTAFT